VLITRFDDRYTEATFSKSGVWGKVPEGSTLIFEDNPNLTQCTMGGRKLMRKTGSIRSADLIQLQLVTDRQTQRHG